LSKRIHRESGYSSGGANEKHAIERFIARILLFNRRLTEGLDALDLPSTEVRDGETPDETVARCEEALFAL
jgi:hypothetical protein